MYFTVMVHCSKFMGPNWEGIAFTIGFISSTNSSINIILLIFYIFIISFWNLYVLKIIRLLISTYIYIWMKITTLIFLSIFIDSWGISYHELQSHSFLNHSISACPSPLQHVHQKKKKDTFLSSIFPGSPLPLCFP